VSAAAAGGYVNFRLDRAAFAHEVVSRVQREGDGFGGNRDGVGRTVVIDYSSPNISKHLAYHHIRSTMIGHSLARIFRANGWTAVGFNFIGDWGTTHGMLLAAWKRWGEGVDLAQDGVTKLNELYVRFRAEMKKDAALDLEARAWFKKLEDGDPEARALWSRFREVSLEEFQRAYDKLGVRFEAEFGESFYEDRMEPVLRDLEAKGLLTISDDATVVDLSDRGLPPCLLRKSDGATLYATRDIASAVHRHEAFRFDLALFVVDKGQSVHFRQWFAVCEKARYPFAQNLEHVAFGQIRFGGRKTSTRTGDVVLLHDALDAAAEEIEKIVAEKNPSLAPERRHQVARQVGYGAIVFADLAKERAGDVEFDWDRLLSFEGDTGPYCQYQHARIAGVLRKSGRDPVGSPALLTSDAEWGVVLLLAEFPARVRRAMERREPSVIATYALDLCRAFSSWYAEGTKNPAAKVNCDDPDLAGARLMLARCVQHALQNALFLIGLESPEEM
jgi:arginyl-tRNA synthetase